MLKKWVYLVGNRQWFLTQEFGTVACLQVNREQTQPGVQTGYLTGSVSRGVCVTLGAYGEDGAEERLAIGDQVVMGMMVEERVRDWVVMSVMMEEREGGPRSRAES